MSPLRLLKTASLAALVALSALAVPQTLPKLTAEQKQAVLSDVEDVVMHYAYVPGVDFSRWPSLLKKHEKQLDSADDQAKFAFAINSAFQDFGFSHIVLFSPVAAEARENRSMVGLGVRIQPEDKGLRVVMVFPGTPAEEAGIEPGDLITKGDDKPIRTTTDLLGEEGTQVKVTVERNGGEKSFTVTRRKFSTDVPESLKWLDQDTALVTVPTFDLGYRKTRVAEIMNEAMKAKNLILDLRNNGGGQVLNLMHLASYFADSKQVIGTWVNRGMADKYSKATGNKTASAVEVVKWATDNGLADSLRTGNPRPQTFSGKIAVLINEGTGSASEMMAAFLHEEKGARLIGHKSAGAVLASLMRPISAHFVLQFPVMDYVTAKGTRLEGHGLVPEDDAPMPKFGEQDKAVQSAEKWFTSAY